MNPIKNIIFDLGDVIINIDIPATTRAFASLAQRPVEEAQALLTEHQVFRQFETGTLDTDGFRTLLRRVMQSPHWSDATLDEAWNALLLDIPLARIAKIQELRQKGYRLFLLSNTSPIHVAATNRILQTATGIAQLSDLFEKMYLSYEMGMMKPDPLIYQTLLADAQLVASETLFLDDNAQNIAAAQACGIQTIWVQKPTSLVEYLADF